MWGGFSWFWFVSLMPNEVEYLFMCLLAVYLLWKKCPFRSFAHLRIGLFVFLLLSCKSSLYMLDKTPITYVICKEFLPFCGLSFTFLIVSLMHKRFEFWWNPAYLGFFLFVSFLVCAFGVISKNLLLNTRSLRFTSVFSFKSFMC